MVGELFNLIKEEMVYAGVETWVEQNIPPVISVLDGEGLLDKYLELAQLGGSVWKSGLPRRMKSQIKEALTTNNQMVGIVQEDPGRFVDVIFASLPAKTQKKILSKSTREYWAGQVEEILAAAEGGIKE